MIFPRPTPEFYDVSAMKDAARRIWDEAAANVAAGIPTPWVEVTEPDEPDLFVSESEARDRQQAYDLVATGTWGPQV